MVYSPRGKSGLIERIGGNETVTGQILDKINHSFFSKKGLAFVTLNGMETG